jgi:hypothetical protein
MRSLLNLCEIEVPEMSNLGYYITKSLVSYTDRSAFVNEIKAVTMGWSYSSGGVTDLCRILVGKPHAK